MKYTIREFRERTFDTMKAEVDVFPMQASVAKIQRLWQPMYGCYIGPGGVGEKLGKYARATKWLQEHGEVWMPLLRINACYPGAFKFDDGRHTFAAMRDLGYETVTVGVPADAVPEAKALIGEHIN